MNAYAINLYALPVVILVGCGVWYRYDRRLQPAWRRWAVVVGLLAACANVVLFVRWQLYMHGPYDTATGGLMEQQSGDMALWLTAIAVAGAIVGKGKARGVLALASGMGFFIWIIPG